jgi:hypothetical protein
LFELADIVSKAHSQKPTAISPIALRRVIKTPDSDFGENCLEAWQAERAIPVWRADPSGYRGASAVQRIAEDAPGWIVKNSTRYFVELCDLRCTGPSPRETNVKNRKRIEMTEKANKPFGGSCMCGVPSLYVMYEGFKPDGRQIWFCQAHKPDFSALRAEHLSKQSESKARQP